MSKNDPKDISTGEIQTEPPIVFDGQVVLIPRATSTQDGYISKEDFAFFLGSIVGVTQINTGPGLVGGPITSTGTISMATVPGVAGAHPNPSSITCNAQGQITAIATSPSSFLPLSGGTMTGPLQLFRDPQLLTEAVTKRYVDTIGPGGGGMVFPSTWFAVDFGVSASASTFNGNISSGSNILALNTSAHDFVVGQGINIAGAGTLATVSGNVLVSKITAISGASITIQDNATATVSNAVVKHDDTVALQTAINTVFNANGGELIIAPGTYRVNGPFNSIKSILRVPYSPVSGGPIVGIKIKGMAASFPAFVGPQSTGVIIQSDRVAPDNTYSIFAVALSDNTTDYTTPNNIFLTMEGLCFRTYNDPNINGLDLVMCGMCWLKNVTIDAGVTQLSGAQPTHNTFGVRLPRANTAGNTVTESVFVINYANGFVASEIWCSFGTNAAIRCLVGYLLDFGWHVTGGPSRLTAYQCPTVIKIYNTVCLDLFLDYENDVPGAGWWADAGTDLDDPSNHARGILRVCKIRSGSGAIVPPSRNGFANVNLIDLGGTGWQIHDPLVLAGKTVSTGAIDSAGTGYKLLMVPN